MREHLSEMDEQTYSSALAVSALQRRRNNLAQSVEMLQVGGRGRMQFVPLHMERVSVQ